MALDFPSNPSTNDTYSFNGKTWIFNGNAWQFSVANSTITTTGNITAGNIISDNIFFSNGDPFVSGISYDQASTSTGYFALPSGTTAQRPVNPPGGSIRFNSNTGEPEWYDAINSQWMGFYQQYDDGTYDVQVLMVAGGGAGGGTIGAGGGAGGVLVGTVSVANATSYTITIGSGGATGSDGTDGGDTTAFGFTANGGGGGYQYTSTNAANAGNDGGSGAGGAGNRGGQSAGGSGNQTGGSGMTPYGNNGGYGTSSGDPIQPGGGGGAGGVGQNGVNSGTTKAGDGGLGIYNTLQTGSNQGYAGGGSGYSYNSSANPTDNRLTYGGGVALDNTKCNGVVNTGGGGAGAGFIYGPNQGAGGSGIVILRYIGAQVALGGSVTSYMSSGNTYTVHTFTSSGTFTA